MTVAVADPDAVADGDGDGDPLGDADSDPLGAGVVLGVGMGVAEGKSELGTFTTESANISTKMTITITTQIRARLSERGGSAPRYPGACASEPRSGAGRR